jgi:quercetin dioxygenase-like cupin family protein
MIRTGDALTNPVTGEQLRFVRTAADTDSECVLAEVVVQPGGAVAAAHVHPYQAETFEILEGSVAFELDGDVTVAEARGTVRVQPGAPRLRCSCSRPRRMRRRCLTVTFIAASFFTVRSPEWG